MRLDLRPGVLGALAQAARLLGMTGPVRLVEVPPVVWGSGGSEMWSGAPNGFRSEVRACPQTNSQLGREC